MANNICGLKWRSMAYGPVICGLDQGHLGVHYWAQGPRYSWITHEEAMRQGLAGYEVVEERKYRECYDHLLLQLNSPPEGWYTFGSHIEHGENLKLDFWGVGPDGLPIWERPKQG